MEIDDSNDSTLKFEYERLQERVLRDSEASYSLMTALVALSEAIFAGAILNYQNLGQFSLISAAMASLSALIIWYPIDRRLVWGESIRLKRITWIESKLNIYNQRLFERDTIDDPDIEDALDEVDKKSGIFAIINVHSLYLIFIALMTTAWIFLIISQGDG